MRSFYTSFIKTTRRLFANEKVAENSRKLDINRSQSAMNSGSSRGTTNDDFGTDGKHKNVDTKTEYINPEGTKLHDSHNTTFKVGISSNVADFTSVNQPESHSVFDNKNKDKTFYKTSKDINLHNNIEKEDVDKKEK